MKHGDLAKSLFCYDETETITITVQEVVPKKESNPEKNQKLKLSITRMSNYKNADRSMEFRGKCLTRRMRFSGTIRFEKHKGGYGTITLFPLTTVYPGNPDNGR